MRSGTLVVLALALAIVAGGCGDGESIVVARIQTGLRAGIDVARSDTWLLPGSQCDVAVADRPAAEAQPISRRDQAALIDGSFEAGTFRGPAGIYTVRVELSLADESLPPLVRCVLVSVQGRRVVRVAFTSGCAEGTCPAAGGTATFTECLNGRCVEPACDPDDPSTAEACCDRLALGARCDEVPTLCRSGTDCTMPPTCTGPPECDRGVCVEPETETCGPGLRCEVALGRCVPDVTMADAGADAVSSTDDASGPRPAAPRPLAPLSLGDVTLLRPTLRWALPANADGAVVELCEDRECLRPIESLPVTGTSARPTNPLAPASVVFWRLRGLSGAIEGTETSPTWLFHTPVRDASAGIDTSTAPHLDIDADGIDDLVVGVPRRGSFGLMARGVVFVYRGRRALGIAPEAWTEISGVADGDLFGGSVTAAGDVNGDGYGDVAVGAYQAMGGRGAVSVFLGSALGLATEPVVVLAGGGVDGGPSSVLGVGDLDGDGYADLAVGAALEDAVGTARVFHGSSSGALRAGAMLRGSTVDAVFGGWLSSGDWNGDGLADLAGGASGGPAGGGGGAGLGGIYLGSATGLGTRSILLEGTVAGGRFGTLSPRSGDLDGDGLSDLVVGAPLAPGVAGAGAGNLQVWLSTGAALDATGTIEGLRVDEHLGSRLGAMRDVSGDGLADLIAGAPGAAPGGVIDAGEIRIFLGTSSGIAAPAAQTLPGEFMESFGNRLSVVGDLDGDGRAELATHWPGDRVDIYAGTSTGVGGPAITLSAVSPLEWATLSVAE